MGVFLILLQMKEQVVERKKQKSKHSDFYNSENKVLMMILPTAGNGDTP